MRILFIAPLPPPLTGQSIECKLLHDALAKRHDVLLVNTATEGIRSGFSSMKRIFAILHMVTDARRKAGQCDVVYMNVSQSIAGNVRDVLLLLLCRKMLPRFLLHLHGGGIGKTVYRHRLLRAVNMRALAGIGGMVVLGDSLRSIFQGMIDPRRISVVPNCAESVFFRSEDDIRSKHDAKTTCLRILFLSNMIASKGYSELLRAWESLPDGERASVTLAFAGVFSNEAEEKSFRERVKRLENVEYLGVISGDAKRERLASAHVLCLPTYYPYEGQPVSILEAYASGCLVLTTRWGGIPDIFQNGINGFSVKERDAASLAEGIRKILLMSSDARTQMGIHNARTAVERYTELVFLRSMTGLLENLKESGVEIRRG